MVRVVAATMLVSASLVLVGCEGSPSATGANAADAVVSIDRSGNESSDVAVNLPGFEAKVRIPGEIMTNGEFDLEGVSLFPGSKISNVKIGSGETPLNMTFEAPAQPARVAAWFQERLTEKAVQVATAGNVVSGTTKDGEKFSITLAPAANGRTTGTVTVGPDKN